MTGRHSTFPGIYRGIVRRIIDDKRGRLLLEVPDVYGPGKISPPAMASFAGGFQTGFGGCWVPPVDSVVWVMFQYGGNPQAPMWFSGWVTARAASDLPSAFKGEDDTGEVPDRGSNVFEDAWENEFTEPGPKALGTYPYVRGWRSESGHIIIMDDTDGDEIMQLTHKDGTQIEWGVGGSEVHRVKGSRWDVVYGNETKYRRGDVDEVIEGSHHRTVRGDFREKVYGTHDQERTGSIAEALDGDLAKTFRGVYEKTLGSESRTIQGARQILAMGTQQTGIGKQWEQTIGSYISQYIGGDSSDPTADAKAVTADFGTIRNTVNTQGDIINETLAGSVEYKTTLGNATLKTVAGGNAIVEATAGEVKLGSAAALTPVAYQGSLIQGTASLGPLNLTVNGTVTTGSSKTKTDM